MKLSAMFRVCLIAIISFSACSSAFAEIYQFTDEGGETYYTNNPTNIPRQYQDSLYIEGEIIYQEPIPSASSNNGNDQSASTTDKAGESQQGFNGIGTLKAEELSFDNEFQALQEERKLLDKAQQEADTREEILDSNAKIEAFNEKFKDFHQRRQAFQEKVRKHNEQVMKEMEERLKEYKARQASQGDSSQTSR